MQIFIVILCLIWQDIEKSIFVHECQSEAFVKVTSWYGKQTEMNACLCVSFISFAHFFAAYMFGFCLVTHL